MNFKRLASIVLSFLVLLSFVFFVPTVGSQGMNGAQAHVYYSSYTVELHSSSSPIGGFETLRITNSTFNGTVKGEFTVQEQSTTYILHTGSLKEYKGVLNVTLGTNGTVYVSSPAPIMEVKVTSGSQQEIAWAGTPSTKIEGYAYINGSGEVELIFLNGTETTSESFNVSVGGKETYNIDVYLNVPSFQVKETNTREVGVNIQGFERYHEGEFAYVNSSVEIKANNSPFSVSTSYFDGMEVPSMIWRAMVMNSFSGLGQYNASFMTVEFFGVNGTEAGMVKSTYVSNQVGLGGGLGHFGVQNSMEHSRLLIVQFEGVHVAQGKSFLVEVDGMPLMVQYDNGNVSTTAYVNMTHQVHRGALVEVFLNGTHFVFVNSSNVTTVQQVKATVKHTVINVNSTQRGAIEADINFTSYAVFNFSVANSSFVIYKNVSGHLVLLNSKDYFIIDGNVTVFSDPAQQYYLVYTSYNSGLSTQSINASSSSTSSLSTSTQSTGTSSQQSTSLQSSSPSSQTPQATSTPQTNYAIYIVAIIVVIVVAIGIAYLLRR
ncbi:hypothetical protein [Sulfuracidifex tepidarius]|uniref:Thermopsin n=1 Tax=Sulfuracidifex tepidarius TaxID=1294262 RepID=A0A510DZS6_9CREN|nr:hypothetical protein [Sulfuracidifex tepidarius]BBG25746.1 hypothetical protein IC007_0251 [Sulfuracidifex tepidarius]